MSRIILCAVLVSGAMGAACAVDSPPEAIASTRAALSTAGESAPGVAQECGDDEHPGTGPAGEDREHHSRRRRGHPHGPELTPRCGNGIIEAGESCDDGNVVDGDGCSATCQPDDDTATPGDDRAGLVACGAVPCGPGDSCCTSTQTCRGAAPDCGGGPMDAGNLCDGPEDCPAGMGCSGTRGGVRCEAPQGGVFSVLCHTDSDCAGVQCPITGGPCPTCVMVPGGQGANCQF